MKRKKGFKIIGILFFGALIASVLSLVVMLLWNFAVVAALPVNKISYWQAIAILILSKILFGGFPGGKRGRGWRKGPLSSRWAKMSEEERKVFREKMWQHWHSKHEE